MNKSIRLLSACYILFVGVPVFIQAQSPVTRITAVKELPYTPIKSQGNTGTCWSYSTTSLLESQSIKNNNNEIDLSEMFTVRNIYLEKAKNYILRQGEAPFSAGGLGHDVIRAVSTYGAVPEMVYSGLTLGKKDHNHEELHSKLHAYLDSVLNKRPIDLNWMSGFTTLLDNHLGKPPETFSYREKQYTPQTFAKEILGFDAGDYVNITSFSHHPLYKPFALEVPDNFLHGEYYNLPLDEMITLTERAITAGYTIMWDADVSNKGFNMSEGVALHLLVPSADGSNTPIQEAKVDQQTRQLLYENLTTQDDHLMHIVGLSKSKDGKKYFVVKNSWGKVGPYKGLIHVSEAYFATNTISMVVPKAAIEKSVLQKLGL